MTRLFILILIALPFAVCSAENVRVTAQPAAELLFHLERSAPAEVKPLNDTQLGAEINARVLEIAVRVGDPVEIDSVLARLDCRDYQSRAKAQVATRRGLETRLRLARTQWQRARDLQRERNISKETVDSRETDLLALEAELATQRELETQAELMRERCEIKAPFRAVVTERLASVGALAAPGTPLLRLVQLNDSEVSAHIRPDEAVAGAQAETIQFTYLGRNYPLATRRVLPVIDPATRTLEVRFGFTEALAPPGASGRVSWQSAATYLPADLLVKRGAALGVFILADTQAQFHALESALEGQPARCDLSADTLILFVGRHSLQDGDTVSLSDGADH
jgi:RND family efflux transporter MFP subunit